LEGFFTLKGYDMARRITVTSAMEDYLEMITRMSLEGETVRIKNLAARLHVTPSAASKMADNLRAQGYLRFERYGYIALTESGLTLGKYFIYRHGVVSELLCLVNSATEAQILPEIERIEHFLEPSTIANMERFCAQLKASGAARKDE
jgi:Mn-dependent DtxR family transcriptional regulator